MKRKLRKRHIIFIALIILTAVTSIWTIWANTALEQNKITVISNRLPKAFSGYKIVQISDLHNAEFGHGNKKLIDMVEEAEPNMIVITGDVIDSNHTDIAVAASFAKAAVKIAPCYFVTGNHEAWSGCYEELEEKLSNAGVNILRDSSIALEYSGKTITLIGLDDPDFDSGFATVSDKISHMLDGVNGYSILLTHRPELYEEYKASGVDLVLCGHAHGGQIRLPFIGGVVAPNQGLFPKYDGGLYTDGNTSMIVSRGLGNSIIPLRFNNRPEVVVVELQSK